MISQSSASLLEIQRWLQWIVTESSGVAEALASSSNNEPLPRLLPEILDHPPIDRVTRLDIYAEGYFIRIVEVLGKDYPAVKAVLGETGFLALISAYLEFYPSRFTHIGDVGKYLANFLKETNRVEEFPFLTDLADLERAMLESFYAEQLAAFDGSELANLGSGDDDQVRIGLDSSVQLLKSSWPIDRIWKGSLSGTLAKDGILTKKSEPEKPAIEKREEVERDEVEPGGENKLFHFLVFRAGEWPVVERLSFTQWLILDQFQKGISLGEVCQAVLDFDQKLGQGEGRADSFQHWFSQWVGNGVIRKVEMINGSTEIEV